MQRAICAPSSSNSAPLQLIPSRLADEQVASLEDADADENFTNLPRKLLRWSTDNMAAVKTAKPVMPIGFNNRQEKNFRLLFAIADLAGGDWPEKARAAALKLSPTEGASPGRRLLADLRNPFAQHGGQLTSEQMAMLLAAEEESEWANYRGRGSISKQQIAEILKPYGVKPDFIYQGGKQLRGYKAAWFETAFKHYLPPEGRKVVRSQGKSHE